MNPQMLPLITDLLENSAHSAVEMLPVMEYFYTLQGEGYHTGEAAYFIRLGGCDVGCHWCDVKESWDATAHPKQSVFALASEATKFAARNVVVTGGEPLLHSLDLLCEVLKANGFQRWIETSGSSPLSGEWEWICLSPKKFKPALPEVLRQANELKIVVYHKSDFDWAEEHAAQVGPGCKLFLQPEWSKREEMMPIIVDYVMAHPQWRISLQTHKYLQIP